MENKTLNSLCLIPIKKKKTGHQSQNTTRLVLNRTFGHHIVLEQLRIEHAVSTIRNMYTNIIRK